MEFVKALERCHVSPLTYESGELLQEKDYEALFEIYEKYIIVKELSKSGKVIDTNWGRDNAELLNKVISFNKQSLFPPTEGELFDMIMDSAKEVI